MKKFVFKGILENNRCNSGEVIGNLIYDNYGNPHIIPIGNCEVDGHHIRIETDLPSLVDPDSIELADITIEDAVNMKWNN